MTGVGANSIVGCTIGSTTGATSSPLPDSSAGDGVTGSLGVSEPVGVGSIGVLGVLEALSTGVDGVVVGVDVTSGKVSVCVCVPPPFGIIGWPV